MGKGKFNFLPVEELFKELDSDTEVRQEYLLLKTAHTLVKQLVVERKNQNLTQKDIAEVLNTKQAYISKFEKGSVEPTLNYVIRYANVLGVELRLIIT